MERESEWEKVGERDRGSEIQCEEGREKRERVGRCDRWDKGWEGKGPLSHVRSVLREFNLLPCKSSVALSQLCIDRLQIGPWRLTTAEDNS